MEFVVDFLYCWIMLLKCGNPMKGDGELDGFTRLGEGNREYIKALLDHAYTQ